MGHGGKPGQNEVHETGRKFRRLHLQTEQQWLRAKNTKRAKIGNNGKCEEEIRERLSKGRRTIVTLNLVLWKQ